MLTREQELMAFIWTSRLPSYFNRGFGIIISHFAFPFCTFEGCFCRFLWYPL